MEPLAVLFEKREPDDLAPFDLPPELSRLYGGGLGFSGERLIANFVSTLDGVVAIRSVPHSNKLISGGSESDQFVMGLLRACADAIVIGSGTFHGSPRGRWTADAAAPAHDEAFAELRRARGQPAKPELAVLTVSGALDVTHPALERGVVIITTDAGKARLRGRLPEASTAISVGEEGVDVREAIRLLRERGHSLILSESGPHVFGAMLAAGVVDELFLTLSPMLAGRGDPDDRLQLVENAALMPDQTMRGELLSVRSSGAHLFLRYALE